MKNSRTIVNPAELPSHFDPASAEKRWIEQWEKIGLYRYDSSRPRSETFVVDTPPPTVSGSLHVGHVFSYTHTDLLVRYQRMAGLNIYYPMGWDDNGLPTERRVQNYFNVRCDPHITGDADAPISAADPKRDEKPRLVSRQRFIQLCLELTGEDEKAFEALWQRIGLSVDWQEVYSTIDPLSRRMAQLSFADLHEKGHVYSVEAPTMWDIDFQTAVAQAEIEDRQIPGFLHTVRFAVADSSETFTIATTRPELLPACVAVTAHPDDQRYKHLFGKYAITPLFRVPVRIFPSLTADPEKGTGIMMVCTFGDANDVSVWRENNLPLRQIIAKNGALREIDFRSGAWPSRNPELAQEFYAQLAGKRLKQAQKIIMQLLRDPKSLDASPPALVKEPDPIQHSVKFFEKGDNPIEFLSSRQWFVRLMDKKEKLLEFGDSIRWYPDHMRLRFRNWTENLQYDWCISRQRYFGVPFPVWYPLDAQGNPDQTKPMVAPFDALPVDPMESSPPGYHPAQRDQASGFAGESDVFDTWFTSSMSPQIASRWLLEPERHSRLFPMDVRPQSHEIIRTWAFYTIAKAMLHENKVPWKHVAISGWVLDPDRKKMSKSKGNVITPMQILEENGSDAVRYWAANARLGTDAIFDTNVVKIGRRLVTKLFNAGKFVLSQTAPEGPIVSDLDLAFIEKLEELVRSTTQNFQEFDYASALNETERFFWNNFTDTFLELVKTRARDDQDLQGRASAVNSLRFGFSVLLRLFAPFLPYITEEIWSWAFAAETGEESIHKARWPDHSEFTQLDRTGDPTLFDVAVLALSKINKRKTDASVSIGRPIQMIGITAASDIHSKFLQVSKDVFAAARVSGHQLKEDASLESGSIEIEEVHFSE